MDAEYVRAEAVTVMQDLLRKYPDRAPAVIPALHRCLRRMEAAAGRAAVIWMIGEYGYLIDDAPYLLEPLIDAAKEEDSLAVRNELLTATLKLFFKRPPEMQKMMGRLFKTCLAEGVPAAVHDRALLYYRLLRASVADAAAVIGGEREPVAEFHDEQGADVKEKIFSEFNSLSVVYGKPSQEFIAADHLVAPLVPTAPATAPASSDGDTLLGGARDEDGAPLGGAGGAAGGAGAAAAVSVVPPPAAAPPAAAPVVDLMSDDLLGLGAPVAASSSGGGFGYMGAPAPAPPPAPPAFAMRPGATLDPGTFQAKWGSLPAAPLVSLRASRLPSTAEVESLARKASFYTIASGDVGNVLKFYFFGCEAAGAYHLLEVLLDKTTGAVTITFKSDAGGNAQAALQAFGTAIMPILAS